MRYRWIILGTSTLLLAIVVGAWLSRGHSDTAADRLLLLLPDGVSLSDYKVTVWLDAASEQGLHVVPFRDSEFVRPFFGQPKCAGVILPDSVHRQASDLFIASLRRFVTAGGKLLLVYDAGTLSSEGKYVRGWSRLSDLAGVDYAMYDQLHDATIRWGSVAGKLSLVRQMEIPPGKYYPFQTEAGDAHSGSSAEISPGADFDVQLRRYHFGDLQYPSFVTSGKNSGHELFHSADGVVASEHAYGNGSVLFVNLPLGYLKANTDGMLLHAFLRYFAEHSLALPSLMTVPDGVGGLVLNWHVDSNAAIKPLREMSSWPLMHQGPYSIHITAGPDAGRLGDGEGFNVEHNPRNQQLVRRLSGQGHQIGSHGGWIHDYFAAHVDKDNPKDLEKYLVLNKTALERTTGKPVLEYSAPDGNQPKWVTEWLQAHGFLGYYYTGDSGMAPTQGYRDGVREGHDIWAFPIVHLNRAAAFEEMAKEGYSSVEIEHWLEAVTEFAVDHHSVRLVYFHPPGIMEYRGVVDQWMEQTGRLRTEGRFRWYTMTELASFLNSRKQVAWSTSQDGERVTIRATHPLNLEHDTWRLPSVSFSQPVVVQGSAQVVRDTDAWMVIAREGKELQFETTKVNK
ncbi:MAG: polysaccharide deacetylase family protein [Terriglobales bacterium]